MISIELKNISKKYKNKFDKQFLFNSIKNQKKDILKKSGINNSSSEFYALQDINLKIIKNDIVGIVGRNGAGKSTLVQIMSGITAPTAGEIISTDQITPLFGFGSCFNSELTGRENIFLTGTAFGMKRVAIADRLNDIINFSEIETIDTPLKFYSNGMKARLGFSISIFIETDLLILDEAMSGGDVFFQKKCIEKLKDLIKLHNKTLILISHNESLMKELCNKVVVMKEGRIVLESDTETALDFYKTFT